jgi:nucleotide-binding universal stress UspA family protein
VVHVLLPIDGSPASTRAVRVVIALYLRLAPVAVTLLHVEVADGVADERVGEDGTSSGAQANRVEPLADARTLLDQAGVAYSTQSRRGYVASSIVECAKAINCDAIVMGTRGLGSSGELLGSVARQVITLAEVPVTLVK